MTRNAATTIITLSLLAMSWACDREAIQPPAIPASGATPRGGDELASDRGRSPTGDPSVAETVPNLQLQTRVRVRLMANDDVDTEALTIRARNGVVWLDGAAETAAARALAESISRETVGVRDVRNLIDAPAPEPVAMVVGESPPESTLALAWVDRSSAPPIASGSSATIADRRAVEGESRRYTVRSGDSLWTIARDQLGDSDRWREVFESNRDVVGDDPDGIRRGMVLTIPPD